MIANGTSTTLGQLLKKHIDDLRPYVFELSKKNVEYIYSLGISSATIASFSLLTLQISPTVLQINHALLIRGFIILISNVVFALLVCRIWIDVEERPIKQSLEFLKMEEELFLISRVDPKLEQKKNRDRWQEIIKDLEQERSKRSKLAKEREFQDKATKRLGRMVYVNLTIFLIGVSMIALAFI